MQRRLSELRQLELIDIQTGDRLGYADDFAINPATGQLTALVQYGSERCFGLLRRRPDRELPFHCVQHIGSQTILVRLHDVSQSVSQTAAPDDPLAPYRDPQVRW